jgi:hypothetical protein
MRTIVANVMTAFAGSLLLAPLMLGLAQAGSAPDLKDAVIATHDGAVMLVREAEAVEAVAAEGMVEAAADSPAATAEAAVDSPAAVASTPMPAAASIGGAGSIVIAGSTTTSVTVVFSTMMPSSVMASMVTAMVTAIGCGAISGPAMKPAWKTTTDLA